MSNRAWKDLVADQGLDLEEDSGSSEDSPSILEQFKLPTWATGLIVAGVCGGGLLLVLGVGGVILYQRRKKKEEE